MKRVFILLVIIIGVLNLRAEGIIFKKGGKVGVTDTAGVVILPAAYTSVGPFNADGLALIRQKVRATNCVGVINRDYQFICRPYAKVVFFSPTQSDYIGSDMDTLPTPVFGITPDNNDTLFRPDGSYMTGVHTCYLPNAHGIRILQNIDKLYGLLDPFCRILLEPRYTDFYLYGKDRLYQLPPDSLWAVAQSGRSGVVDVMGNVVIPFEFSKVIRLGDHLSATSSNNGVSWALWRDAKRLSDEEYDGFNFPTVHSIAFAEGNQVGLFLLDTEQTTRTYSSYIGCYDADSCHGYSLHVMSDIVGKDTTYYLLNDYGQEVIPSGLIQSREETMSAVTYLRSRTIDTSSPESLRRFRLGISRHLRKYVLTSIIPVADWDY